MTFNITGNTIELQSGFTLSVQTVKFTSGMTATGVGVTLWGTNCGVTLWGTNCPAGTVSAPYTWIRVIAPDGSVCFIPAYK